MIFRGTNGDVRCILVRRNHQKMLIKVRITGERGVFGGVLGGGCLGGGGAKRGSGDWERFVGPKRGRL